MNHSPSNRKSSLLRCLGLCCGVLATAATATIAQVPNATPVATAPPASEAAKPETAKEAPPDVAATRFLTSCSGCHTLTDVKLTGPGLAASSKWPEEQLKTAIKRMEGKVGPLKPEDLTALANFIKDGKSKERLAVEQEKMQARFMAKMDPADAALGSALFTGSKGFKNGGLACAACHSISGTGGNLGPDLTGIFAKMGGKIPLISAIEKSNFKIMAPHYRRHPVATQEAVHLAEYFSKIDPKAPVASAPMYAQAGAGLAGLMLAGMTLLLRSMRSKRGRDTKLTRRRK
ncbi:MAG: c-type cytochrome [Verrucomicrobiota bacterium]